MRHIRVESFELLMDLGGEHILSDFPHIFASSKEGFATHDPDQPGDSMRPLFDMMLEAIPGPEIDPDAPLQMLVTNLDWSDYVGRIAVGRIYSGSIRAGQQIALMQSGGQYADLYNTYFRHQSPDYRPGEGFVAVVSSDAEPNGLSPAPVPT